MIFAALFFILAATGTVSAQAAPSTVAPDLPTWVGIGGSAALVGWVLVNLFQRAPRSIADAVVKLADNQAEAIKLDRERFEAQKIDDAERNQNISALIDEMKAARQLQEKTDKTMTDANQSLGTIRDGVAAANAGNTANHDELVKLKDQADRLQSEVVAIKESVDAIKASVRDSAARTLTNIETKIDGFAVRLAEFVSAAAALTDKLNATETEVKPNEPTTIHATATVDIGNGDTGASDAAPDAAHHPDSAGE